VIEIDTVQIPEFAFIETPTNQSSTMRKVPWCGNPCILLLTGLLFLLTTFIFGWIIFPCVIQSKISEVSLNLVPSQETSLFMYYLRRIKCCIMSESNLFLIFQKVKLTNGSEVWEKWRNVPIPIYLKIYLFNVSNPIEVLNGSYPKLNEIGPFVYLYAFYSDKEHFHKGIEL